VVGVVLWLLASFGFSVYVRNFSSYDVSYGALGGVIVLLMWMWISAQVILLGAEINALLEHKSPEGKAPGAKRLDEPGPNVTKGELRRAEEAEIALLRQQPPPPPPVPPRMSPLRAAITWATGFGMGLLLMRRSER
jgi:membrane protein